MRKRLLVLLAVVCVLAVALTASGPVLAGEKGRHGQGGEQGHAYGHFKDVGEGNWAYYDITIMEAKGVFAGYGSGEFGPQDPVSCIQLAVLAVRLTGGEAAAGAMPLDEVATILSGTWLDPADPLPTWAGVRECLAYAYQNGYLNGIIVQEQKLFRPNDPATRLEVLVTLLDAMGLASAAAALANEPITAPDADTVPAWATGYVVLAMDMGLLRGDDDGALNLGASVTRAQMAALLRRADDKFESDVDDAVIEGELVSVATGDAPSITISVEAEELRDYTEETEDTSGDGVAECVEDDVEDETLVEVTFPVTADASIFRDDVPATLADLVAGDEVKVRIADGAAVLIDADVPDSEDDVEADLEVAGPFVSAEYAGEVLTSITITVVSIDGDEADDCDDEDEDEDEDDSVTPPGQEGAGSGDESGGSGPTLGADATFAVSPDVVIRGTAGGPVTFAAGDFLTLKLVDGQVVAIAPATDEDDDDDEDEDEDEDDEGVCVKLKATFDSTTADTVTFTITVVDEDDEDVPAGFELGAQLTLPVAEDLEITGPDDEELALTDLAQGCAITIRVKDGVITRISLKVEGDDEEDEEEDD